MQVPINTETKIKTKDNLNPQSVLEEVSLEKGDIVADLGCGAGHFVIPAAKIVGEEGKVFAIDILPKPLEAVLGLANLNHLQNIVVKRANLEQKGSVKEILEGELLDCAILSDVLFANNDKAAIINEAASNLKSAGQLIIIDWLKSYHPAAAPEKLLVDPQKVTELCAENGLEFKKELEVGEEHWGKLFKKT